MTSTPQQHLSHIPEMTAVHIDAIQTDTPTRIRLLGMGLGRGTVLEVLRNRYGDMVLGMGNNRISLGRSITAEILVTTRRLSYV